MTHVDREGTRERSGRRRETPPERFRDRHDMPAPARRADADPDGASAITTKHVCVPSVLRSFVAHVEQDANPFYLAFGLRCRSRTTGALDSFITLNESAIGSSDEIGDNSVRQVGFNRLRPRVMRGGGGWLARGTSCKPEPEPERTRATRKRR